MAVFTSVLVANRGEIACRVIETLQRLGIRSIAVYSDADRGAKHVRLADAAVRLGPAPAVESYLNIDAVVAAAVDSGAQAVHPGYGFLSENVLFARACEKAGIVFIGPGEDALNIMGDKIRSKQHVGARGVPLIAGIAEPGLSNDDLVRHAGDIGFPILVKPSAGGGGKGMTVVERAEDLSAALSTARRVAKAGFGDDTLFLEQLVLKPRHIEVQVLADNFGHVIHLGERECSLQRRHQKIIEEAPSALLDAATRERIGEAACEVARSVNYRGAGTVEFLVSDNAPEDFFFLEMNTRLQVEHPVTELVTGVDLVEQQLRIAAGEPLGIAQGDIVLTGHAIEARLYAESPDRGFLPTTGTVLALHEPTGTGVRIDSSLVDGLEVGSHYDPMLAKIIAWGEDRAQALARLDAALAETTVLGVHTNLEYLRALIAEPEVQAGALETGLVERLLPGIHFRTPDERMLAAAALSLHADSVIERTSVIEPASPLWRSRSGWRIGERRPTRYTLGTGPTESVDVFVLGTSDNARVTIGEVTLEAALIEGAGSEVRVARDGAEVWVGEAGSSFMFTVLDRAAQLRIRRSGSARAELAGDPEVRSPMPGTVVAVAASTGDTVEIGAALVTVEAMKMEHTLVAPLAGVVTVNVKTGDLVKLDQVVATIEPHEGTEEGAAA